MDVVSGRVVFHRVDVELPAVLPLVLARTYASGSAGGLHGPGWSSTMDQRLEVGDAVRYHGDGRVLTYREPGLPERGTPLRLVVDGGEFLLRDTKAGWTRHFAPNPADDRVRPITALTDRNGNRVEFRRDHAGVPVEVVHSGGYRVLVDTEHDAAGPRVTALRLADVVLACYRYDDPGRLTEVVDTTFLPFRYRYDDADRVAGWTDREGFRYAYTYRADGRVVRGEGERGIRSATVDYDVEGRSTTVVDSLGGLRVFRYDVFGNVTEAVDPRGNVERAEHDRHHRLLSRTDGLGHTTRWTRDEAGDPVRVDRPDGTTVTAEYNALRRPTLVVGPDGARYGFTYDERGNLLTATDPGGAVTRHTYGEHGELRSTADALGNVTTFSTNAAGLPVEVVDAENAPVRYEVDARGRLVRVTDVLGGVTEVVWGNAGGPARCVFPDGTSRTWSTNGNGDVVATTDRAGHTTRYEVGPFHFVTARVDPDGARHEYAHDTELRLVEVADPRLLRWRRDYDGAGNLVAERDFNGRSVFYEHDAANRLVRVVNGGGLTVVRDEMGRVVAERADDGQLTTFGHDAAGRLVVAVGPDAELVITRDAAGRVVAESVNGRTVATTRDALGRRTSRTTPAGRVSHRRYDRVGLPVLVEVGGRSLSVDHDPLRRETFLGTADVGVVSRWDAAGRLVAREVAGFTRTWRYRGDGVPVEVRDAEGVRRYELDVAGRVTAVRAEGWRESYRYDRSGNPSFAVDTRSVDSAASGPRDRAGTLVRRAGRVLLDHDAQGRLVRAVHFTLTGARRTAVYEYDVRNRLVGAVTPTGERWRYRYDPVGRRIAKQRWSAGEVVEEVRFHWDGGVLVEQERSAGGAVVTTTWEHVDGVPITQQGGPGRWRLVVTDPVGAPTELVAPDGRVVWRLRASALGEEHPVAGAEDCPLRAGGRYHDRETGLHHGSDGCHDPRTGCRTAPAPVGPELDFSRHPYVSGRAWDR
ncbi:DUF6531 domain-containing protein [Saccharothrix obliqua]|uniref:DUF6531 domain-containing protein n=1 Tax=Saccharothrix obliqua TaxID=2861747 RepID=UPI001C5F1BB7|nr:DUF6531 domain-containing protein [Saccharothrix obliqua]MBW4718461.1 type IV secretion protein Rhs [Saccharothrix obliqua]